MTTALKIQKHLKKAAPLIRQILAAKDGLSEYFYFTGNKTFDDAVLVLTRRIDDTEGNSSTQKGIILRREMKTIKFASGIMRCVAGQLDFEIQEGNAEPLFVLRSFKKYLCHKKGLIKLRKALIHRRGEKAVLDPNSIISSPDEEEEERAYDAKTKALSHDESFMSYIRSLKAREAELSQDLSRQKQVFEDNAGIQVQGQSSFGPK